MHLVVMPCWKWRRKPENHLLAQEGRRRDYQRSASARRETDKAVVEIEATGTDFAGVKSKEGDVVPVGTTTPGLWLREKPPAESSAPAKQAGR
jgi:hypothetical protein